MEITPDLETGDETSAETEVSSANEDEWVVPKEEETPATYPQSEEEFNQRVERLMTMMEEDSSVRDRLIAETYVNIASAEMGIRGMFTMFQEQGMAGLMKGAFRRGG